MNAQLNRFCVGIWKEVTISISVTRTFERGLKVLAERASITKRDCFRERVKEK